MKKTLIKKYLGEMLLLIGVTLFVYNILNFSSVTSKGVELEDILGEVNVSSEPIMGVEYYYTGQSKRLITGGALLMVLGTLIMKKKDKT